MTRAQANRLLELLERIQHRHDSQRIGHERLLREAATWQDTVEALTIVRGDESFSTEVVAQA